MWFKKYFSALQKNRPFQKKMPRKLKLLVEALEERTVPTTSTITQWNFNTIGAQPPNYNNPVPTTGVGTAVSLGMSGYTNANGLNTTVTDDVLSSTGVITPSFSEQTWRVRGDQNGWALSAPQYTQGIELDASTAGYTGTQFSFDWYSTTQGVRDLQIQYNTNISNSGGWTNYVAPNESGSPIAITGASESGSIVTITTGSNPGFTVGEEVAVTGITTGSATTSAYNGLFTVTADNSTGFTYTNATSGLAAGVIQSGAMATPTSVFIATSNDFYTPGSATTSPNISISLPSGANNDPNLGIRLVSANDPGMYSTTVYSGATYGSQNLNVTYASAAGNGTLIYNNNSGNWRFDNLSFKGTLVPGAVVTSSAVTASPVSPQNPSTSITFTDTITPGSGTAYPTGTVQFFNGATPIGGPVAVTAGSGATGVASLATTALTTFGVNTVTAQYTPTGAVPITGASWASGVATITLGSAPGYIVGQPVTIAGMTPAGYNGTFNVLSDSGNSFTYSLATNPGTATTLGTSNAGFLSTASSINFNIGDPTTTTVAASPASPQNPGTAIILAATVTPANIGGTSSPDGNPTGTVAFFDGTTQVGTTQTVTNGSGSTGTASVTINTGSGLSLGTTHSFTAVYSPPQTSIIAASQPTFVISAASASGTTVTITTSAKHGFVTGQLVTIAGLTPSGDNGTFTITVTSTTKFTYTGVSGSPTLGATPTATGTTVTLTTSTNSNFVVGQSVDVTGITPATYDGTFTLISPSSGTTLTYVATAGAAATVSGTALVTNHGVTSSNFLGSTSAAVPYTIGDPTTSIISSSPNSPQQVGTLVTFTDTITPANLGGTSSPAGTPTGTVKFFDGVVQIGATQTVTAGSGSTGTAGITISTLSASTHNITATYTPTGQFLGSSAPAIYYALFSGTPGPLTPGNLVVLQAGDGNNYNSQGPLYLDEINATTGATVQQDAIPAVGAATITTAGESGTTVTISTGNAPGLTGNGFTTGEQIAIAGLSPSGYDGTFTITTTGTNSFTYTAASGLGTATFTSATATPGQVGNQPITIDLSAAAGNGQLTRSYDGSAISFNGIDSTINNGGLTSPATPAGQSNRVVGILSGGNPSLTSSYNTTTSGGFYVGDDNRGSVAESPTGPIYTAGHPNQAGGAVSQGVHEFDTTGPSIGTQVSASTNIRGVNIGFDNRMYFSTASGLGGATPLNAAGIFTEAQALPTSSTTTPSNDIMVVPAIFGASKLGGLWLADMNGDGIVDNGDRLYFVDDGTVGGAGTGGLYVSTWNDSNTFNAWNTPNNVAAGAAGFIDHWSVPVRLGDAPVQTGSGGVGQLRGITGTVVSAGVASASESGTTVTITLSAASTFTAGQNLQISGVGAGYDGSWTIATVSGTTLTYTALTSGLTTVTPSAGSASQAVIYTNAYDNVANDNSIIQQWIDTGAGVSIANAHITTGTTVQITTVTPNSFHTGQVVEVDGVGADSGASAITTGYNGSWNITVIDSTHFTYNDTNSGASGLPATTTSQGAANLVVTASTLISQNNGTDTVGSKTYGAIGLRGVSFAPVAATSVVLTQSPANPLSPGTGVTLTATLSNLQITSLSGIVTFIDQNTNTVLGSATIGAITANEAILTLPTGVVGNHYVQAYFAGGGSSALASARSGPIQVIEAGSTPSTTIITTGFSAVAVGKQDTLTATVTPTMTGATPTGTVSFYDGSVALANLIGTATLNGSGIASVTNVYSALDALNSPITEFAVYNGDNTYASSQGTTMVTVAANATATITSSANNVALNATPTYTATINGNATLGSPAGTVVFTIVSATGGQTTFTTMSSSAITLIPGASNTSTATWTSPALSVAGSYLVTISYAATGATNPYNNNAVTTTTSQAVSGFGDALIETVQQAFTPGNLVAVQRGDGTVNLGSSGYLVFLDEYTPSGTLVQSIAMPNLDASGNVHGLLLSGQNGSEGLINRSANNAYLTLSGYDLPVGHTFVTSTFPYQYPRTIAEINGNASIDTSTAISTTQASITAASEDGSGNVTINTLAPSGFTVGEQVVITGISPAGYDGQVTITGVNSGLNQFVYSATPGLGAATLSNAAATSSAVPYNPLDVVSNDGNEFWVASNLPTGDTTDSGILYVGSVGATTATQIGANSSGGIDNTGAASIAIAGGNLIVAKGSGDVQTVGTGLPTTLSQVGSAGGLIGLPNLLASYSAFFPHAENPEQILLLNTNDGTSNNPNVAYIADQANGILKFYLNSATITSLSEDGTGLVTVTTSGTNGFSTGDQVQIAGASVAGYNGKFTINSTGTGTFTYNLTTLGLAADTSGTGTASEWLYGRNGTGVFGQKLIFAGGATGISGYVINPGGSAQVQLYVTGSNVQQQNPNQLDSFLDANSPSNGFPSGNVTILGFVGGAGGTGSPNGNENFAGLAFVPGYKTSTNLSSTGSTYTATVTAFNSDGTVNSNVPTGVVYFNNGTTFVGSATLNGSGVATFSSATPGLTATYQGDVKDDTSTGPITLNSALVNANTSPIKSLTVFGNIITVTTLGNTTYAPGESVLITGSSVAADNGSFVIQAGSANSSTFTYLDNNVGIANALAGGTVTAVGGTGSLGTGANGTSQRSMVDSIIFSFSAPVVMPTLTLTVSAQTGATGTVPTWTLGTPDGGMTWVVTFSGAGVTGNSIADGVYDVGLTAGIIGQNYTFYRLFGDINGDKQVNNAIDYTAFKKALGSANGQAAYVAAFDYNADGQINNAIDYTNFKSRLGRAFAGFTINL